MKLDDCASVGRLGVPSSNCPVQLPVPKACETMTPIPMLLQEGAKRTIPWFRDGVRCVTRHPLNQRKTGGIAKQYMAKILDSGLVQGVRGEPWFQADPDKEGHFLAISFGTLILVKEVVAVAGVQGSGTISVTHNSQLDRYCQSESDCSGFLLSISH